MDVEKRQKALELRASGWTYAKIGKELKTSTARAAKVVAVELDRLSRMTADGMDQKRQLEQLRLDALLEKWWPRAMEDEAALEKVLAIVGLRARLLGLGRAGGKGTGQPGVTVVITERTLDAPKQVTVLDQSGNGQSPEAAALPALPDGTSQATESMG
jgi:hypothetical protein